MRKKDSRNQPLIREKLGKVGVKNLNDEELISLILCSGNRRASVSTVSKRVLTTFPTEILHQLSLKKITKVSGIGIAKAAQIIAAVELGRRNVQPKREKLINPESVLAHLESIRKKRREHTVCLYLNGRHELLHKETIAIGGLNYSLLEARDVFSPALRLPAASIIMAHNHPSGSIQPSEEDIFVTKKLINVGELLGVTLLDHLIITRDQHASIRELGYFGPEPN